MYKLDGKKQYELLRRLQDEGLISRGIFQLFDSVRYDGNKANHEIGGDAQKALNALRMAWQLEIWFERTFYKTDFEADLCSFRRASPSALGVCPVRLKPVWSERLAIRWAIREQNKASTCAERWRPSKDVWLRFLDFRTDMRIYFIYLD